MIVTAARAVDVGLLRMAKVEEGQHLTRHGTALTLTALGRGDRNIENLKGGIEARQMKGLDAKKMLVVVETGIGVGGIIPANTAQGHHLPTTASTTVDKDTKGQDLLEIIKVMKENQLGNTQFMEQKFKK